MMRKLTTFVLGLLGSVLLVSPAQAATATLHNTLASFNAAAGVTTLADLEGFAPGTNLSGVSVLPGVSATTNMTTLQAFNSGSIIMFGNGGRELGNAAYTVNLTLPYLAFAFDITGFEAIPGNSSTASGPGLLTVSFSDATSQGFNISGNLTGSPVFVGLTSNTAITRVVWAEALEASGTGNEETGLDNFRVGQSTLVPEPASMVLLATGLVGLLACSRRYRA